MEGYKGFEVSVKTIVANVLVPSLRSNPPPSACEKEVIAMSYH